MIEQPLRVLQRWLVCPVCKGELEYFPDLIRCQSCSLQFPQSRNDCFDLLPQHLLQNKGKQWEERQQEMKEWYKALIASPAEAKHCFENDYIPHAPLLATLSGKVLDIGGGIGIVQDYLPRNTDYTVIDPDPDWLVVEWTSIAERFPSLEAKSPFVRGVGEYLPFPARAFDAVLALWSLNHVSDPERVFSEVHRVLRLGGRFVVVLEDMPPSWGDIANGTFPASRVAPGGGDPSLEYPAPPSGREWPLQSDHLRIRELDIRVWSSRRFEIAQREWINEYLRFEFRKTELSRCTPKGEDTEVQRSQRYIRTLQNQRRDLVQRLQVLEAQLQPWQGWYGYTLTNEVRDHVQKREWRHAFRSLLMLLRYYLGSLVNAIKRIK
jgi:SAM-dependent methyltransferase